MPSEQACDITLDICLSTAHSYILLIFPRSYPRKFLSKSSLEGGGLRVMVEGEASRVTQWALSSQKDTDEEVREFLQNNLNLQGKVSRLRGSV